MLFFDCTNIVTCVIIAIFFVVMNLVGYINKKSWFSFTAVIVNVGLLILHTLFREQMYSYDFLFNINFDLICLAVNISMLIIVDEIEIRRSIIKEVFKNRYKKKWVKF